MGLFDQPQLTKAEALAAFARTLKLQAADTLANAIERYNLQYDTCWHNAVCESIEDAQAMLDALGDGVAAQAFQASYALGSMINAVAPETIPEGRMTPPVAYTVDTSGGFARIVLDPEAVYPGPIEDA